MSNTDPKPSSAGGNTGGVAGVAGPVREDTTVGGNFDVLIVGGGHAGVQVASVLAASFKGSIALLSAERSEPYERPPLTKGFLTGEVLEQDLLLRPTGFWKT